MSEKIDYPVPYFPEITNQVLSMYLENVTIIDIACYFGMSEKEINDIIDRYSPSL